MSEGQGKISTKINQGTLSSLRDYLGWSSKTCDSLLSNYCNSFIPLLCVKTSSVTRDLLGYPRRASSILNQSPPRSQCITTKPKVQRF